MRRITIFTDEDSAKKACAWLEAEGLDYMSEDYAEPSLHRRQPPLRRSEPERHEASKSFLTPLKRAKPKTLREAIIVWLKEAGVLSRDDVRVLAKDAGWNPKLVKDTVRRLIAANQVHQTEFGDGFYTLRLTGENNG
jgi:hypothetical protein